MRFIITIPQSATILIEPNRQTRQNAKHPSKSTSTSSTSESPRHPQHQRHIRRSPNMYNNPYRFAVPGQAHGPFQGQLQGRRGEWYIDGIRRNAWEVQRRPPGYVPMQSWGDNSGRYAYDPRGQQYPRYQPNLNRFVQGGVGDYGTGQQWMQARPSGWAPWGTRDFLRY